MNIVIIDTGYPINYRNRKLVESFREKGDTVYVIAWNRDNNQKEIPEGYRVYECDSSYGNKWKKVVKLFGFKNYCYSVIKELKPDVIIASHWETLFLVPRLNRTKQKLIYENLDVPTGNFLERGIASLFERIKLRKVDLTIFASRFFYQLYSEHLPSFVLENKPNSGIHAVEKRREGPLVISYIGIIRYIEIIKNLIDAVRNDQRFFLYFRGSGPDLTEAKDYSKDASNIVFSGYYDYSAISGFYSESDLIWGVYPNDDFDVKYAISNKFHESLKYGVPCIYANKTKLAEFVMDKGVGLEVDPYSVQDIKKVFSEVYGGHINLADIRNRMINMSKTEGSWEEDFDGLYSKIIGLF